MIITITVDLNDKLIKQIVKSNREMGVTKEEVVKVVTEFLEKEVGTESGLLSLIDQIDLFNY